MEKSFQRVIQGYKDFRQKYASNAVPLMQQLAEWGQHPSFMFVACCDSRVDPAILVQCHPGDIFIARNIANIVPPYEKDDLHHGTSAALEFGLCYLNVKHLIIMGHSECGGIAAFLDASELHQNDFIGNWTSLIEVDKSKVNDNDQCAKLALLASYKNALTFPWLKERFESGDLKIHLWFFDISSATIETYDFEEKQFKALDQ